MEFSRFSQVNIVPPVEEDIVTRAFTDDPSDTKVNLAITGYRNNEGKPWVYPVVRNVEKRIAADDVLNHENSPVLGLDAFTFPATKLLLGAESFAILQGRAFGVQTLSGAGALRIGAEFLYHQLHYTTAYFSKPCPETHREVFSAAGFVDTYDYHYWNEETKTLDVKSLISDLRAAAEDSVVVLQACSHNPTGSDPTPPQWALIADVMEERRLFPFFYMAFQGFISGDPEKDAWPVRYFVDRGFELFCAQSLSKNFGLYNERVGNLGIVLSDKEYITPTRTQLSLIICKMYSTPPGYGARIVATILNSQFLYEDWKECLRIIATRIKDMRHGLKEYLDRLGTPGSWDHLTAQVGMYCFTGLTSLQVEKLVQKYHIYMLRNGRINVCALTVKNLYYIAESIHETILHFPKIEENKLDIEENNLNIEENDLNIEEQLL